MGIVKSGVSKITSTAKKIWTGSGTTTTPTGAEVGGARQETIIITDIKPTVYNATNKPPFTSGGGGGGGSSGSPSTAGLEQMEKQMNLQPTPYEKATGDISYASKIREQNLKITALRNEANRRGINIDTSVRQRGFINQLNREEVDRSNQPVTSGGYFEQRPTGEVYNGISASQVYYVNEATGENRLATANELKDVKFYSSYGEEGPVGYPSKTSKIIATITKPINFYNEREREFAERTTIPIYEYISSKTGLTIKNIADYMVSTPNLVYSTNPKTNPVTRFESGMLEGIGKFYVEKPITAVATARLGGAVIGGSVKSIQRGLSLINIAKVEKITKNIQKNIGLVTEEIPPIRSYVGSLRQLEQPVYLGFNKINAPAFTTSQYFKGSIGGYFGAVAISDIVSQPTIREAGIVAGTLSINTLLFAKGYSSGVKAMTPVEIKTALRDIKIPEFKEVSREAFIYGKQTRLARYEITGEVRPPILSYKSSPFSEHWFQYETKIIKPRTFKTLTPDFVVGKSPFYTATKKGKYGRYDISLLKGSSEEANLVTGFRTPVERLLKIRLGEVRTKGTPLKEKDVSLMFSKNTQFFKGDITEQKILSLYPKTKKFKFATEGKTTRQYLTISSLNKISTTEVADLYKTDILFKDVTYPFARASGKTPRMKGVILDIKEPLIIGEDTGVKFIQPANIKKTPLSKTFQLQDTKVIQQLFGGIPKPTRVKAVTTTKVENIPTTSLFSGTGLYERTEEQGAFTPSRVSTSLMNIPSVKSSFDLKNLFKTSQIEKQKPMLKEELALFPAMKEVSIVKQQPKLSSKLTQKLKQKQTQKVKLGFPTITPTTTRTPPRTLTSGKAVLFPKIKSPIGIPSLKGLFGVQVRRKGKFIPIGTGLTSEEAQVLGKQKTQFGLGQTFKITGGATNLKTPKGYYKKYSKKEGILFIELPKTKINTRQEKMMLQELQRGRR